MLKRIIENLNKAASWIWGVFESKFTKVLLVLLFVLFLAPWIYENLGIAQNVASANYYDFLNSCLLLSVIIISIFSKNE
jgi:hypothetical protein